MTSQFSIPCSVFSFRNEKKVITHMTDELSKIIDMEYVPWVLGGFILACIRSVALNLLWITAHLEKLNGVRGPPI